MASVSFQQGVNGYTGTVDTMIQQATPTTAYGTSTKLITDTGTNANVQTLLTFDGLFGTGPGQIPLGATITSATLTLQTTNGSAQGASLHRMLTNWTGVPTWTWDSFNNGIQFDGTEAVAAADVSTGAVVAGSRDLNVMNSLQAWSNGAANYGWAFKAGGTDGWDFYSAQGATKPKLTVTYTTDTTTPPVAGFSIVQSNSSTRVTEGGATDTFTVALTSAPSSDVVITINNTADATGSPANLTFTPSNWQTTQTVTVSAVDDALVEGPETSDLTFSVASTDARYNNFTIAPVAVAVTDDDMAEPGGLTITPTNGSTSIAEGGAGDIFTVALNSAPTANVTITVTGNSDIGRNPATLTFTPTNWNSPQTVTLTAVDDTLAEGTENSSVTLSASSTDSRYNNLGGSVAVTISDNDSTSPPAINATVVAVHDTTRYKAGDPSGYGSGDPSGLAYVPGSNTLFIADSEHEESPYFSTTNLFAVRPDGTHVGSHSLTGFSVEPTGLGYNPKNGYLYITDDDALKVLWVDPANPSQKIGEFSVKGLGMTDPEDPKIDPVTGNIYMLDGFSRKFFELSPTGALLDSFVLPSVMTDAEALAYDPSHDVFFVASGASANIWEMDRDGQILATINVLASGHANPISGRRPIPKGLELAPSSNPNDGNTKSLFVADMGNDQVNDGRLFEISLGTGWLIT